jgi:hypothetical protein
MYRQPFLPATLGTIGLWLCETELYLAVRFRVVCWLAEGGRFEPPAVAVSQRFVLARR